MTLTLWSNAGKHEFLLYRGDRLIARSGLVHPNRASAKRAALAKAATL